MAAPALTRAVVVLLLALPASAAAEPVRRVPDLPDSVPGARIVLHYTTTGTDAITAADAARLAGIAPAALTAAMQPYLPIVRVFLLLGGAMPDMRERLIQRIEAGLRSED